VITFAITAIVIVAGDAVDPARAATTSVTGKANTADDVDWSKNLVSMMVIPVNVGDGSLVVWNMYPIPKDLTGYHLEKHDAGYDWQTLVFRTGKNSHHDDDGAPGDSYRLFAINGLGEEIYLGEATDGRPPAPGQKFSIWPVPFRNGDLNVAFPASPGGAQHTRVAVYDVMGRHIHTIFEGSPASPAGQATWDGRNSSGRLVPAGVYFVRVSSGPLQQTRKLVIVR